MNRLIKSAHFLPGYPNQTKVAFVLSAPGLKEKKATEPAAGQTGKNLIELIQLLHTSRPDWFPSKDKKNYRITNSVSFVMPRPNSKRTEPYRPEVWQRKNMCRLIAELAGMRMIICLGQPAGWAGMALQGYLNTIIIFGPYHIGSRGVSTITQSLDYQVSPPKVLDNNAARLKEYASLLARKISRLAPPDI